MARVRVTRSISRSDLEAAAKEAFLHSLAGGLVGLICLGIGAYLIAAAILGPATNVQLPIPGSTARLDLPAGLVGALAAFIGIAVIWITRASVAD
ncbi:MAG TPA: hypothetical protein VHK63_01170 [Candidatus Limnocylindria bacterium]|nr:hypothetical protein [Candidatus Limnocylindria bacterium]